MSRKQSTLLFLFAFWAVVLGATSVWFWQTERQEHLNRQLIEAIKREDTPTVLAVLNQGADGNAREEPSVPASQRLWDMVWRRRAKQSTAPTALLLLLGKTQTPFMFHRVTRKEYPELISALLAHGARTNMIDEDGSSPLFLALESCKTRTARLLIENGANVTNVQRGWNLLALEVFYCHDTGLTDLMLQQGAEIDRANSPSRWTPISLATSTSDSAIVRLLLRHHANPNTPMPGSPVESILKYAEEEHKTEIARLLREAGAKK